MEPTKLRDLPPFSLRLPPDLRQALEREAGIHARTLSAEIIRRLRDSLDVAHVSGVLRGGEQERPTSPAPQASHQRPMTDHQRMLLAMFDALPPDKQLALLTVLRR